MPRVNYCRKCKREVPAANTCPYCSGKLSRAGERISFTCERRPAKDWFAWNAVLRVLVPVFLLVLLFAVLMEALAEGSAGVTLLFTQGFAGALFGVLGVLLIGVWLVLLLQGKDTLHYAVGSKGVQATVYVRAGRRLALYARLTSPRALQAQQAEAPAPPREDLWQLNSISLSWAETARAVYWPQMHTILLFKPRWWQAMCIRCPKAEYAQVEALVRAKIKRKKTKKRK
ncbi:MAG: hypothetical protein PHO41_09430 [Eubacteriales bacterium]|nr:hypothetical protein [Eubacteriales bacterium]